VRIHEVDAFDHALDLDGLRAIEAAEPVVGERRRGDGERGDYAGDTQPARCMTAIFSDYVGHSSSPLPRQEQSVSAAPARLQIKQVACRKLVAGTARAPYRGA
jgi:hypothetical protein